MFLLHPFAAALGRYGASEFMQNTHNTTHFFKKIAKHLAVTMVEHIPGQRLVGKNVKGVCFVYSYKWFSERR